MKNLSLLLVSTVVASATSLLAVHYLAPAPSSAGLELGERTISEDAEARIAALERSIDDLKRGAVAVEAGGRQQIAAVDEGMTRAAVRAWLDEHASEFRLQPAPEVSNEPVDMANLMRRLSTPGLTEAESHEIWKNAQEAGLLAELLATYQLAAEQNPGSAQAQVELGSAYLQALQHEKNPMKQGEMSFAADASFDAALALDERNWDARFLKGLSLSFWPDFLGKQGESIRQFEILIEHQESSTTDPKHAQSYVMLGNLYASRGDQEKAQAMFNRGYARFPDNSDLKMKAR